MINSGRRSNTSIVLSSIRTIRALIISTQESVSVKMLSRKEMICFRDIHERRNQFKHVDSLSLSKPTYYFSHLENLWMINLLNPKPVRVELPYLHHRIPCGKLPSMMGKRIERILHVYGLRERYLSDTRRNHSETRNLCPHHTYHEYTTAQQHPRERDREIL